MAQAGALSTQNQPIDLRRKTASCMPATSVQSSLQASLPLGHYREKKLVNARQLIVVSCFTKTGQEPSDIGG
ncbi:MAG: hypothetical protein RBJ76_06255 [Stenomitos frigidus ULC029]